MRHFLIGALLLQSAAAFQLRVTIYDQANLSAYDRKEAFDLLRRVFRIAKISVEIVAGESTDELTMTAYPVWPPSHQLAEAACNARRDIALEIASVPPVGLTPGVLS